MGEAFLDYAKELFREGKLRQAYDMAHLVSFTDCNCPGVHTLLAIYSVLLNGTTSDLFRVNCYKVLNVSSSASTDEITHKFATLKKLVAQARTPYIVVVDRLSTAAAAEEANSLLNFAFQVLSDEKSRSRFDASWNIRPAGADNNKKPQALPPTPPLPEKKKPPQPQPPLAERKKSRALPPLPPPLAEKKKPTQLISPPPIAERKKPRVLPPPQQPFAEKRKRELTAPPPPPLDEKKKPAQLTTPPPPAPVGGKRKREIIPYPTESKKRQSESEKPTFTRIRVVRSDETWEGYSKLTKSTGRRSSATTAAAC
ncbi:hypothetical protein LINPERHAP1_LOCUS24062 [Linum perenne]